MKVALVAEGCYPFATGGVSTWCDQLIRGLPDVDFDVFAVTGGTSERAVFDMPPNVGELRIVPLWGWGSQPSRPNPAVRALFLSLYRPFLWTALSSEARQEDFTRALRELFGFAQQHDLTAAMQTDEAVSLLSETWGLIHPEQALRMREAVEATELIEHFLRPLSGPVVQADLCHAVSNGIPVLLALAAKWTNGTPLVMSEHGVYLRERYLSFRTVKYRWPVKAVLLAIFRRICATGYASSDRIVPVNFYNHRWETRHGADPDTIATAFNGVHAADYPALVQEPETRTIGWVGRIDPLKDLETLLRAFALVRKSHPDVVLRLFGPTPDGNEAYAASVRKVADELQLGDAVAFEGPVRPVTTAYQSSTIVALSSISEGLPYTVMEAMMCGRATVSTEVGGVPEVVGEAGLLVPPRDPAAFAAACERLLESDDLRLQMAADARERALELFQIDQMLQAFLGIYTSTLANAPSRTLQATHAAKAHGAHTRLKRPGRHLRVAKS